MHIPNPIFILHFSVLFSTTFSQMPTPLTSKKTYSQVFLGTKYITQHKGERTISCRGKIDISFWYKLPCSTNGIIQLKLNILVSCTVGSTSSSLFTESQNGCSWKGLQRPTGPCFSRDTQHRTFKTKPRKLLNREIP